MPKFFSRIRKHLLKEGKVINYLKYAIGEIFLVVIGILIALQVNNWKEGRTEIQEEQKLLKILKSEFEYNKVELQRNIHKSMLRNQMTDSLISLFSQPDSVVAHSNYPKFIGNLSTYSTFDPSNGALSDLLYSGKLKLIQNDTLRLKLSRWFGEMEDIKEDEIRLINFGDRQMEPWRLSHLNYNKKSKFPDQSMELIHNHTFENIVVSMWHQTNYILKNYEIIGQEIDAILLLINEDMNH